MHLLDPIGGHGQKFTFRRFSPSSIEFAANKGRDFIDVALQL